ncbi:hypothetical protein HED55_07135 [Ochrobactrum haematophilum]|uniref:Uncharacterized protein n=2 Tax=Brucella haematophila TaxID=419474 RepID=A0ABX1DNL2_9HYPH|nr:hypothetical protein [Brucella haematophila]
MSLTSLFDNLYKDGYLKADTNERLNIVANNINRILVKGRKSDVPGAMYPLGEAVSGHLNVPVSTYEPIGGVLYDTASIVRGKSSLVVAGVARATGQKTSSLYPATVHSYDAAGYSGLFGAPWEM